MPRDWAVAQNNLGIVLFRLGERESGTGKLEEAIAAYREELAADFANLMKICDQTGHKSLEMLRVYSRDAELFAGNAAAGLL